MGGSANNRQAGSVHQQRSYRSTNAGTYSPGMAYVYVVEFVVECLDMLSLY